MSKNVTKPNESCVDLSVNRSVSKRPVTFDAQAHAENLSVGSDDHVSLIVEAQPYNSDSRDDHFGFGVRIDSDDAAMTATTRGNVEIAFAIERQALRPAKSRKEVQLRAIKQ